MKNRYIFLFILFYVQQVSAQIRETGITHRDDLRTGTPSSNAKRSAQNPVTCGSDTVEYPRYKASNLVSITVGKGRGLGQLYSCPKPVTLTGFTFYAFVLPAHNTAQKMDLICRVYKAGADSLPTGAPLRADTLSIDSTLGGGLLSVIVKRAGFPSITLDSNYILTIETEDDSLTAGLVTNNYTFGDGEGENLNCGSISGLWYNGRNLRVGTSPFDADILLHPWVTYPFGTDFQIRNNCYGINDSIKFINASPDNMSGSRMYNRYKYYNIEYICHRWNLGNSPASQSTVDHKVKYAVKQNYQVRLISTVYGYTGDMYYGCSDTTVKPVYFKPDIPTISGLVNVCVGDSSRYTAVTNDTGVTFEWLKKPNDALPFHTGKSFLKYPVTQNDTFYLRANNHGCLSGLRTFIIRANTYPQSLTVQGDSVCSGSRANLSAVSDTGSIQWFSTPLGGTPLFTGKVFQTGVLMSDTTFWVQANNNGCILSPRTQVSALVGSSFAPSPPVLSNDTTVCLSSGSAITLNATAGAGLSVRWFSAASGGSSIHTGNNFLFMPVKREIKTFWADAYNGVCGSTRVPVNIEVEHYPSVTSLFTDTICKGDSARMGVRIPYGEASWYSASSGGLLLHQGENFTDAPDTVRDYFVETSSNICVNPVRTKISATVNTFPDVKQIWGDTICAKNKATLKTRINGPGTMEWFDTDTGQAVLATGLSFETPVLNGQRAYYARPVYAGCTGPRMPVQPLVRPGPFSGFSFEVLTWQQVRVSPINAAGCSIKWDLGDGTTSNLNSVTHRYQNPGTYHIKLILTLMSTGCKDSTTIPVQIEVSSIQAFGTKEGLRVYPNPVTDFMHISLPDEQSELTVDIYSTDGRLVRSVAAESSGQEFKMNSSGLTPGLYLLHVKGYAPALILVQ